MSTQQFRIDRGYCPYGCAGRFGARRATLLLRSKSDGVKVTQCSCCGVVVVKL